MKALLLTILINVGLHYGIEAFDLPLSVELIVPITMTQSSNRKESK
ncbi:hypothetical protein [Moritella viscosa]|nr:hypothetical protein [Moritella viscosa]SGZ09076.1 Putative uncharacterized protein [Moritella viscosa]